MPSLKSLIESNHSMHEKNIIVACILRCKIRVKLKIKREFKLFNTRHNISERFQESRMILARFRCLRNAVVALNRLKLTA